MLQLYVHQTVKMLAPALVLDNVLVPRNGKETGVKSVSHNFKLKPNKNKVLIQLPP